MDHGWKTLNSKYVLENPWYKVRQDQVTRPNGQPGVYNVVETGGSVHLIALTDEGKVLLVKLYRYTISAESWEIPAGFLDHSEKPIVSAKRELQEETGYLAEEWHDLGVFQLGTGIANAPLHLFVAKKLRYKGDDEQAEEGITAARAFSIAELKKIIADGTIVDGPTLAGLARAHVGGYIKL